MHNSKTRHPHAGRMPAVPACDCCCSGCAQSRQRLFCLTPSPSPFGRGGCSSPSASPSPFGRGKTVWLHNSKTRHSHAGETPAVPACDCCCSGCAQSRQRLFCLTPSPSPFGRGGRSSPSASPSPFGRGETVSLHNSKTCHSHAGETPAVPAYDFCCSGNPQSRQRLFCLTPCPSPFRRGECSPPSTDPFPFGRGETVSLHNSKTRHAHAGETPAVPIFRTCA